MNKILQGAGICVLAVYVTGCSSKPTKTTTHKPAKTHQVQSKTIDTSTKTSKGNLAEAWKTATENRPVVVKKAKKRIVKRPVVRKPKVAKRHRVVQHRKPVARKQYHRPKQVAKVYRPPVHSKPVTNIKYANLRGDYAANNQTKAFIDSMARKHGFDRGYLNYLFSHAELTPFLRRMSDGDSRPLKKIKPARAGRWTRYRGNFLTEKTISKGVQFWKTNRVALQRAEDKYGVPKEYILGIIGVETRYGGNVGKNRAIDALSAMGFNNARRGKYFRSELESYLLMTRQARLDPLKPMASYAGALGLCQFMPSNIKRYGVDFDRSGSCNLWTPQDAVGSVANYFKKHGWRKGGTVAVPAYSTNSKYKMLKTGFKSKHSLARLKKAGISANRLGNLSGKVRLIKLNTYSGDELWLGGHNFYVITRYNHSSRYAMAVHQLAQAIKKRIGGRGAIRQASLDSTIKGLN